VKNYDPRMSFRDDAREMYGDGPRGDEEQAVAFLESVAGGGPALELGIGTGRIALPLAARGVRVDGIDLTPEMVAQLRTKPGGDKINVTIGDMADVAVDGAYRLIYVVFNTFFNILTQDGQVRCFQNVAERLADDGVFVIEAYSPEFLYRMRDHQYVDAEAVEVDRVRLDVLRHDPATQMIEESHVQLSREGVRLVPVVQRYAWPAELDLMARMAGLRLKDRWDGWDRRAFSGETKVIVSVYGR
jgi:SAM-dependent methyltransferase